MKLLVFLFLFVPTLFAQDSAPASSFNQAIQDYQAAKFQESFDSFANMVEQHPDNPNLLYNYGLSAYQLGKKGLALGLWRKARFLNPGDGNIDKAIDFAEEELQLKNEGSSFWATLARGIKSIPLDVWLLFSLFLTLFIGWKGITFFAKRKIPFFDWPTYLLSLIPLWILFVSLSAWLLLSKPGNQGTIVEANVATHTGPSPTTPTLSSLEEGSLVKILKTHTDWVQIKVDGGPPGWVLQSQLIAIEGLNI